MNTPTQDGPHFVITLRDVYEAVQSLAKKVEGVPDQVADHESRLRYLERAVWISAGVGAAGGLGLTKLFGG